MALITGLVGWLLFRGLVKVLPKTWTSVAVATFAAGIVSVVASALGFVFEYSLGGVGDADIGAVFAAMIGVHFLIGVGEGIISLAVVGLVGATRPDLVAGINDLELSGRAGQLGRAGIGGVITVGLAWAAILVFLIAPLANENPDGLERVAIDQGFDVTATDSAVGDSPLADYGVTGVDNDATATGISGAIGIAVTFGVALAIVGGFAAVRKRARSKAQTKAAAT
jgi:cobalt/nickel transport system permease protein